ncbi:MAG TPA: hypothetical protein VNA25_06245 [Phycisphaerae bacterium]|nr:hypothetical protein [Phycisphaerae bacterium]
MGESQPTEPISEANPLGFFAATFGFVIAVVATIVGLLAAINAAWVGAHGQSTIEWRGHQRLFRLEVDVSSYGRHERSFHDEYSARHSVFMDIVSVQAPDTDWTAHRLQQLRCVVTVLDHKGQAVHAEQFDSNRPLLARLPGGGWMSHTLLPKGRPGDYTLVVQVDEPASVPAGTRIALAGWAGGQYTAAEDAWRMGIGAGVALLVAAAVGVPTILFLRRRGRNTPSSGPPPPAVTDGCAQIKYC